MSSPNYDKSKALKEQKQLLILKKERLERLIFAIDGAVKGENVMKAFDNSEFEKHMGCACGIHKVALLPAFHW